MENRYLKPWLEFYPVTFPSFGYNLWLKYTLKKMYFILDTQEISLWQKAKFLIAKLSSTDLCNNSFVRGDFMLSDIDSLFEGLDLQSWAYW